MNLFVSPTAVIDPHTAPFRGGATVVTTRPVAADSTSSLASGLFGFVTTTWNGG